MCETQWMRKFPDTKKWLSERINVVSHSFLSLQIRCCFQPACWSACCAWATQAVRGGLPVCWRTWSFARRSLSLAPTAWRAGQRWPWPLTPFMSTSAGILTPRPACYAVVSPGPITSPSQWASSHTKTFQWCWWRTGTRCRPSCTRRTQERRGR